MSVNDAWSEQWRRAGPLRYALASGVAIFGIFVVTLSMAQVVAAADPALAHRLAPYDGRITARLAMQRAGDTASFEDRRQADILARLALRQSPTALPAAVLLGLDADLRGDHAAANSAFTYAQTLSRRDVTTQLWGIEAAVARGDILGALENYDIALRVNPKLSELLYPVLAAATSEPEIRNALLRTLAARPPWGGSFITYLAAAAPDPGTAATLLRELRRARTPVSDEADARVVNALLDAGRADDAWTYYRGVRAGADRRRSRDARFASMLAMPSRLDWVSIEQDGIVAGIRSGVFDFAAPAGVGGTVLQQQQLLSPGRYRLSGRASSLTPGAAPYWVLTCGERELGRVALRETGGVAADFAGILDVPAGCPLQTLAFVIRPSDAIGAVTGQLERAELGPVSR